MKKGLKLFATVLTVLLLSTGCVKYETTMTINDDNSIKYSTIIGYNKEYITEMGGTLDDAYKETTVTEDMKKEYKKAGITIDSYEDDDTIGVSLYKVFDSIDDITTEVDTSCELDLYNKNVDNQYCFKKTKGFFFDTYEAKISTKSFYEGMSGYNPNSRVTLEDFKASNNINDETYDTTYNDDGTISYTKKDGTLTLTVNPDDYNQEYDDNDDMLDAYKDQMSIKFILNNYSAVGKNNATKKEKDGKRLIWDFTDTENKIDYIQFEIKKPNWVFIILGIISAVVIVILIIGIIGGNIVKSSEKKKEQAEKEAAAHQLPTMDNMEQVGEVEENPMINKLLAPDSGATPQSSEQSIPEQVIPEPMPEDDEPIKTDFYE